MLNLKDFEVISYQPSLIRNSEPIVTILNILYVNTIIITIPMLL